jgi:hypothetical protein
MAYTPQTTRISTSGYSSRYNTPLQAQSLLPVAQNMASQIFGSIKPPPGYGDSLTAIRQAQNRASHVLNLLHYLMNQDKWAHEYNQRTKQVKQSNPSGGFHIVNPEILYRPLFGGFPDKTEKQSQSGSARQSQANYKAEEKNKATDQKNPDNTDNPEMQNYRNFLPDPSISLQQHKHKNNRNKNSKQVYNPELFYMP